MNLKPITDFRGEYRWLSNYHECRIVHEGIFYPSTEHAYQAAKTLDLAKRREIAGLSTPGKAKRAGNALTDKRPDWDDVKVQVMREVLIYKFVTNRDLEKKLMETKGRQLIEGNTWGDKFWGVCDGEGQNWLGRLLMEIRDGEMGEFNEFN